MLFRGEAMNSQRAQRILAGLWLLFFICQAILLVVRAIFGGNSAALSDSTNDMWKWYLPMILPTISIVLAATFATRHSAHDAILNAFGVVVAVALSTLYLLCISCLLLIPPTVGLSPENHVKLLHDSGYWLSGMQVGVGLAIGYVFGRNPIGHG